MDLKGIRKINDKEGIPIGAIPVVTDFSNPEKVIKSIKNALDYLAEIEFKTESKKDKLSNILTEYSIQVKQNYY